MVSAERALLLATATLAMVLACALVYQNRASHSGLAPQRPVAGYQAPVFRAAEKDPPCDDKARVLAALTSGGHWEDLAEPKCGPEAAHIASCTAPLGHQWVWDKDSLPCSAQHVPPQAMLQLLRNKTLAIIGDSHGRFFYSRLIHMLEGTYDTNIDKATKFHHDAAWHYSIADNKFKKSAGLADVHLRFLWRNNLLQVVKSLREMRENSQLPDIVIISSGSWYGFFKFTTDDFSHHMKELQQEAALVAQAGVQLFQITVPTRIKGLDEHSTWHPVLPFVPAFNHIIRTSTAISPAGPILLLDIDQVRSECLLWCHTSDGAHSNGAVYAVMFQLLMNMLRMP